MPVNTFTITTGANDGRGGVTGTISNHVATSFNNNLAFGRIQYGFTGASNIAKKGTYFRFAGITIPAGATINSATLKVHMGTPSPPMYSQARFTAKDSSNPGNPTSAKQIVAPNGGFTDKIGGVAQVSITNTGTSAGGYQLYNVNVTSIVSNLVGKYTYNNDAMLFRANAGSYPFITSPASNASIGFVYLSEFGSTNDPELVIDYTADDNSSSSSSSQSPVLVPKTRFGFV
jgi:hypothetical protein